MSADANGRLVAAHVKLAAAKTKLADASKAAEAARGFASEIGREVLDHLKRHQDLAASRAAGLMQALKIGSKPKFKSSPKLADDYVAKLDAEHRSAAATQALRELVGEESSAQRELDEAVAELHAAARAVLSREAAALVQRISDLEAESMQKRVAIEAMARSGCFGFGREIGLTDAVKEVLRGNSLTPVGITNHALWREANVAAEGVRQRYDALLTNKVPALSAA